MSFCNQFCLAVVALLVLGSAVVAQQPETSPTPPRVERTFHNDNNQTTIRLAPVKIAGEQGKYRSVQMSPAFTFSGTRLREVPSIIDFEVQTVVNGRLDSDLYVVFVIDGENVFLSSSRSAINRPVPGRVWVGERLVFRMPYEIYLRVTKAKEFALRFDGVVIPVSEAHLKILRDFLSEMQPNEPGTLVGN
jgi:hypothetical protein